MSTSKQDIHMKYSSSRFFKMILSSANLNCLANQCFEALPQVNNPAPILSRGIFTWLARVSLVKEETDVNFN